MSGRRVIPMKRADFLAAARGRQVEKQGFVLQSIRRMPEADEADAALAPRFGFTISKRVGNAVLRNRIRRRLREAVKEAAPGRARGGSDYVLIARRAALDLPFARLISDIADGIDRIERGEGTTGRGPRRRSGGRADAGRQ
jgi:ribonuclease P protein component